MSNYDPPASTTRATVPTRANSQHALAPHACAREHRDSVCAMGAEATRGQRTTGHMHVQSLESSTHNTHTRHHKIRNIIAPQVSHLLDPVQALLRALQNSKQDTGRSANMRANKMHELKNKKAKSLAKHTNAKSRTRQKKCTPRRTTQCA